MSKEGESRLVLGVSGFVIPSAFVIRHSSFPVTRLLPFTRLTLPGAGVRLDMKTLIVSATIGALTLGSALADRPVVEQKTQADNADYEYVTVTGSHLKQKIRKRNIITNTRYNGNVLTIDQREMERNGNGDLA